MQALIFCQPRSNNTLYYNNCPNAGRADEQVDTWIEAFASSIADRLNSLAVGEYVLSCCNLQGFKFCF